MVILPLIEILTETMWAGLLIFLRVGAMVAVLPVFGERLLSVRIKLVVALLLTVIVLPALSDQLVLQSQGLASFLRALMTETISGLFLGLMLRMFIFAIQTAGSIAAQTTSLAQLLGQSGMDPLPALGNILTIAGLALLMVTGFHVKAAAFVILSYDIIPAMQFPDASDLADAGRARVASSFALAFTLAAPFVILSVLYNLTLGVINKAMPQLMVAFVGAPVITFGSIAFLFVSAPLILTVWLQAVDAFLASPFR